LHLFDDFANELPGFGNRIEAFGLKLLDPVIGYGQGIITVLPDHLFDSTSNLSFIKWRC
jgi:hypothetical protein